MFSTVYLALAALFRMKAHQGKQQINTDSGLPVPCLLCWLQWSDKQVLHFTTRVFWFLNQLIRNQTL